MKTRAMINDAYDGLEKGCRDSSVIIQNSKALLALHTNHIRSGMNDMS